jgi:hypothetical protein
MLISFEIWSTFSVSKANFFKMIATHSLMYPHARSNNYANKHTHPLSHTHTHRHTLTLTYSTIPNYMATSPNSHLLAILSLTHTQIRKN